MAFKLISDYQPTGDQPEAINLLIEGIRSGTRAQTLLGVTGSGKTFTIANVIAELNRPTLVLSHNKTLAAQLYGRVLNIFSLKMLLSTLYHIMIITNRRHTSLHQIYILKKTCPSMMK